MKRILIFAFLALQYVLSAQAQLSNTTTFEPSYATKGVRVSLLKPLLEFKIKATQKIDGVKASFEDTEKIDQSQGFALGYAHLPVSSIGYLGQVSYLTNELKAYDIKNKFNFLRFEGNAAWAVTQSLYFKAGLNYADMSSKNDSLDDFEGTFGFQVGTGFQITQNLGIDLAYSIMNFKDKKSSGEDKADFELSARGLEFGLTGTF